MKIYNGNPYEGANRFTWLMSVVVLMILVTILFHLRRLDAEVMTVVLEPRETSVDPYYEVLIEKDLMKVVKDFGQWGAPAYLEDVKAGDEGVNELRKRFAINVNVSDRISYTRDLPDPRPFSCRNKKEDPRFKKLPSASIIIVTRNEAWSVIVRTLHTVLHRTPTRLVKEVIVVDDGSAYPGMSYDLVAKLNYYITRKLPQFVRLITLKEKSGIVPARLAGAKQATGEVLVFLDAHCEVNDDWLEPLLERIKINPKVVVQPVVDAVDWDTFEYSPFISNHHVYNGAFTWAGAFEWLEMSVPDILKRTDHATPHKNPVMAGGLFAIKRTYFWDIGSYDDQMYDWGFENIEMSIRVWTCGGSMEIVPCSRVGHIFHSHVPELVDANTNRSRYESMAFNLKRTVKVWFDEYERLVYQYRPSLKDVNPGDIAARQEFRQEHQCKPFKWFVTEVVHKFVMDEDAIYSGRLASDTGFCLTYANQFETSTSMPILLPCDSTLTGRQYWAISKNQSELRREFLCVAQHIDMGTKNLVLRTRLCDDMRPVKWNYHKANRTLEHAMVKKCLDSVNGKYPLLTPCHPKKPSQKWIFVDNATLNVFSS